MTQPHPIDADDFRRLEGEVSDMKQLMGQMTNALTRLALLEERQQSSAAVSNKILDQVEQIRAAQHTTELRFANYGDIQTRVQLLEAKARDDHLEYSKDKAGLTASLRTMKMVIGASWVMFVFVAGALMKFGGI